MTLSIVQPQSRNLRLQNIYKIGHTDRDLMIQRSKSRLNNCKGFGHEDKRLSGKQCVILGLNNISEVLNWFSASITLLRSLPHLSNLNHNLPCAAVNFTNRGSEFSDLTSMSSLRKVLHRLNLPHKGSFIRASAVCGFQSRLHLHRDRNFSISLCQHNHLLHASLSNAASVNEP